jgi:hypothetical protein
LTTRPAASTKAHRKIPGVGPRGKVAGRLAEHGEPITTGRRGEVKQQPVHDRDARSAQADLVETGVMLKNYTSAVVR